MRLLLVTQYFWPETFIVNDLALELERLGHQVTVLTGKPNYPEGRIHDGYTAGGITQETFGDAIPVHRVPLRPRGGGGAKNLILNYLSFLFSGLWRFPRMVRGERYDVVFFFAPSPMTSAITAIPLKFLTRAHFALWIQDLWPESLSATGYLRNRPALFLVRQLVRLIYAFADTLLIQSEAFRLPVARLAAASKIVYYPNFSRRQDTAPAGAGAALPPELGSLLQTRFCVVFAGNLGTAQALETIVEAAALLRDLPELKLVLVGSGSLSGWLDQQVRERQLDNLILPGRLPAQLMPELYRQAQGLLVTLKDQEIFSYTVPSKVQGYLAAGKPVIAAINGETARLIERIGAGYACPAENPPALADRIRNLYHATLEERAAMGRRGLEHFMGHFEMTSQVRRLVDLLDQRIAKRQS